VNGLFITGTDTGVGKTHVTCALARRAVALGRTVFAFKPIETGCEPGPDGALLGADQALLVAAAGGWQRGELAGVYRYPLPAAPRVAAAHAGASVDLGRILDVARRGAAVEPAGLTLVEGAGGWRVPITDDADMGTLARALALPVLVVSRAGLGTINHTLLTVEAVERDGLTVAGVVLSQRPGEDPEMTISNRAEIRHRWPGLVVVLAHDPAVLDELPAVRGAAD
jgi:dethiobiotin synthetase